MTVPEVLGFFVVLDLVSAAGVCGSDIGVGVGDDDDGDDVEDV